MFGAFLTASVQLFHSLCNKLIQDVLQEDIAGVHHTGGPAGGTETCPEGMLESLNLAAIHGKHVPFSGIVSQSDTVFSKEFSQSFKAIRVLVAKLLCRYDPRSRNDIVHSVSLISGI